MRTNRFRRSISGAGLALAMLLGVVAALAAPAQAQYRDRYPDSRSDRHDDQSRWDRNREMRYANLLGYHEAYSEGSTSRGRWASYRNTASYRDGTSGYQERMGNRNTYRDAYRRGYKLGFEDGQRSRSRRYSREDVERELGGRLRDVYSDGRYDREDPNHESGRDRRATERTDNDGRQSRMDGSAAAQDNGYRDGLRGGEQDRTQSRTNEYGRSSEYRDGMRGYRSEFGDREQYRRAYREGYQRGYDESYRR